MKICSLCKTSKPLSDFYKRTKSKDGYQPRCKTCSTTVRTQWGRDNPEKISKHRLNYNYGLTPETHLAMWNAQGGLCLICSIDLSEAKPHIDHDHATGRVRGILCNRCNLMVGWYESITDHDKVINYLTNPL